MTIHTQSHATSASPAVPDQRIGVVAIGRNEGARLVQCLSSLQGRVVHIVYVDSGSTDDSVAQARRFGAAVVELDMHQPFTAARARNRGFERLMELNSALPYVQFLDGDCTVVDGWLQRAAQELDTHPTLGVVCGRRAERHPGASKYNRLCDLEWNTPIGDARSCGGDAMMRTEALRAAGGYDDTVIAGEEPELCVRLRGAGWGVRRIDALMTIHDAAMTRFGQWWKRNIRAGHAYAQGAAMHGRPPERHCVRQVRSNYAWGLLLPLLALGLAWPTRGFSLLLLLGYPLLMWKITRATRGRFKADAAMYARYCVIGKPAQAWGQLRYLFTRLLGRQSRIIEYKKPETAAS